MRKTLQRMLMFAFSAVLLLALIELVLRFYDFPSELAAYDRVFVGGTAVYLPSPHQEYTERWFLCQRPHKVVTNALGLRDRTEYASGGIKIAVLGDEPTFGAGVSFEETYAHNLEEALRGYLNRSDIEVINMGMRLAGIREEKTLLKERGLALRPTMIILQFSPNDVGEAKFDVFSSFYKEASNTKVPLALRKTALYVQFIRTKLSLLSLIKRQDRTALKEPLDAPDSFYAPRMPLFWQQAWDVYCAELEELVDECRERGIVLGILVLPARTQVADPAREDIPQKALSRFARARGVYFLDPLSFFRERFSKGKNDFYPGSEVLNADGQYALSTFLFDRVLNIIREEKLQ
ncbi:MAG: SGNH/GDSL hydrolase family protein [Candidatus Omnitrophica bacterium]|nr:SGNH/GDSL hydrolase family protein [Candidatus Omnitrophota bacterium]